MSASTAELCRATPKAWAAAAATLGWSEESWSINAAFGEAISSVYTVFSVGNKKRIVEQWGNFSQQLERSLICVRTFLELYGRPQVS